MKVWLIVDGESLPLKSENERLFRIGILAEELCSQGHSVTWWSSNFNHHRKKFRLTNELSEGISSNLSINLIDSPGYKKNISLKRIFHNIIVAKRFRNKSIYYDKPDVILCCVPTIELSKAAVQYGARYNIPTVIDLRDMWPDIFIYAIPSFLKNLSRLVFYSQFRSMKYLCSNATALVGVSEGYLKWGLSYANRERDINDSVFPLGYVDIFKNTRINPLDKQQFLNELGCSENDFIIVYVGSLTSKINFNPIIESVSRLGPTVKLVIAGLGDTYESLKKTCMSINNVILTGWLDKNKIIRLLTISTIGLYPYPNRKDFDDHFPNKFIEYLCASMPILSRVNSSEITNFLQKYNCGITYNDDIDLLTKKINSLASNRSEIKKMSLCAREVYEKKYCSKKVYRHMTEYLTNLTNKY